MGYLQVLLIDFPELLLGELCILELVVDLMHLDSHSWFNKAPMWHDRLFQSHSVCPGLRMNGLFPLHVTEVVV